MNDNDLLNKIKTEFAEARSWALAQGFGLKAIKHARIMSEETNAFRAVVTKNGKAEGEAENDGHGGSTGLHLSNALNNELSARDLEKLEMFVDGEVERDLQAKEVKRIYSSRTKANLKKGFPTTLFLKDAEGLPVATVGLKTEDPAKAAKHLAATEGAVSFEFVTSTEKA